MAIVSQAPFDQWVETARHLGHRSAENVACPCCGSTSLSVRDVEYGFGHDKGVQRYISCGCCGAFTGVNVRRAGAVENDVAYTSD
jgi:formate dehydrogenase maturation protein FdhE